MRVKVTWLEGGSNTGRIVQGSLKQKKKQVVIIFDTEPEEEYAFEYRKGYWYEINNSCNPTTIEEIKEMKIKKVTGDKSGLKLYAEVPSSSHPCITYTVAKRTVVKKITIWTCTCAGYAFRGTCKHIAEVKEVL